MKKAQGKDKEGETEGEGKEKEVEEEEEEEEGQRKFQSLSLQTFPAYYRVLLTHLDSCLADLVLADLPESDVGMALARLNQIVLLFQALCHLSRCEVHAIT